MSTVAPKKILIVDDDKAVTKLLSGVLSAQGYTVLVANDGLDGMALADCGNAIGAVGSPESRGALILQSASTSAVQKPSAFSICSNQSKPIFRTMRLFMTMMRASLVVLELTCLWAQ